MDWLWAFQAAVNALIVVILFLQARRWGRADAPPPVATLPPPETGAGADGFNEQKIRLSRQIQAFEQICTQAKNALHRVQQSPRPMSEEEAELLEWMSNQRQGPTEELPALHDVEKKVAPRTASEGRPLRAVLRDQNR